jgi:hypothetical protein
MHCRSFDLDSTPNRTAPMGRDWQTTDHLVEISSEPVVGTRHQLPLSRYFLLALTATTTVEQILGVLGNLGGSFGSLFSSLGSNFGNSEGSIFGSSTGSTGRITSLNSGRTDRIWRRILGFNLDFNSILLSLCIKNSAVFEADGLRAVDRAISRVPSLCDR